MSIWPTSNPPWIMGILNVTPDSFSDGGKYDNLERALSHARAMIDEGAHIIDIGGESTRPGSQPVAEEEQTRRAIPVIRGIRAIWSGPISIDTTRAAVAEHALNAGATWINDVSALRDDPAMSAVAAEANCPIVLMHMQGKPRTMQANPTYTDVVSEVADFLRARAEVAQSKGIASEKIILDPGIGFGKTVEHNLSLLRNFPRLTALGYRVLVGASRKSFIGKLTDASIENRIEGSIISAVCAVRFGAVIVRVHDVGATRRALAMDAAINGADELSSI